MASTARVVDRAGARGPDTTERVETAFAFRLLRLKAGETCESIVAGLRDGLLVKKENAVTLPPPSAGSGDCPLPPAEATRALNTISIALRSRT